MNIAIAGFGQEGRINYSYWNHGGNQVTILDERDYIDNAPQNAEVRTGSQALSDLQEFDIVVRTAGLSPNKLTGAKKIWSATNEFFDKCPAPIIGVTGTKGKGTTSSLIAAILRAAGKTVHLIGNIGVPALEVLPRITPDDIVVFEISSFQLWDITKSPHVAVVLGIEPDHLDVHASFDDYLAAKANIRRFQTLDDICIYHPTNQYSRQIALAADWFEDSNQQRQWQEQARRYGVRDDDQVYEENGNFCAQGQSICSVSALQIPGRHNIENACAAISAARQLGVDEAFIEQGLRSFTGLPHRIKFVREIEGIRFYDDSYSSAPSATVAAIRSFTEPEIILLGGYDRGADFTELANCLLETPNIKIAIIYGQTKERIKQAFRNAKLSEDKYIVLNTEDFTQIMQYAANEANSGDVVIFSPACPSFDMFKNFTERGERFIEEVERL